MPYGRKVVFSSLPERSEANCAASRPNPSSNSKNNLGVKDAGFFHGGWRWIRVACGRPGRGSDSPPGCHSLPLPSESLIQFNKICPVSKIQGIFYWWTRMDSDHRSLRNRFTVCPLWPLGNSSILNWSWWTDLNPRPADYKSAALPTELHQPILVGATGLEPAASWSQTRHSTKLSYAPLPPPAEIFQLNYYTTGRNGCQGLILAAGPPSHRRRPGCPVLKNRSTPSRFSSRPLR